MPDYFTELGKQTAKFLSTHPEARAQIRGIADQALTRHLSEPGLARDSLPQEIDMPPRGAEAETQYNGNGNGGELYVNQCILEIQSALDRLDPAQRPALLGQLAKVIEQNGGVPSDPGDPDAMDGLPHNNLGALDQRSGRRGAFDRRPAMDAATMRRNNEAFSNRWGGLTGKVEVWGTRS